MQLGAVLKMVPGNGFIAVVIQHSQGREAQPSGSQGWYSSMLDYDWVVKLFGGVLDREA